MIRNLLKLPCFFSFTYYAWLVFIACVPWINGWNQEWPCNLFDEGPMASERLFSCRRRFIIHYVPCFFSFTLPLDDRQKNQILAGAKGAKDPNRSFCKPQRQEILLTERFEMVRIWRCFAIIIYSYQYSCQQLFQQLLWTRIYKGLNQELQHSQTRKYGVNKLGELACIT